MLKGVRWGSPGNLLDRLKAVGTLGDGQAMALHRANTLSPQAEQSRETVTDDEIAPLKQVVPEPKTGGGENRVTGGVLPVLPANGNRGGTTTGTTGYRYPPIGVTPRVTVPGNTPGPHLAVPNLLALAGAKTTMPPPPRGGAGEVNTQICALPIPAPPGGEPAEKGEGHDAACPGGCSGTGAVNV